MQRVFTARTSQVALLVATVVLSVSGPFGTFEHFNIGQRVLYWGAIVVTTYTVGQSCAAFLFAWLKPWIGEKWPRVIVAALLTALPVTAVVLAIDSAAYFGFSWEQVLPIWFYVTLITLVIFAALVALTDRMDTVSTPIAAPGPAAILERVPLPQRGRLLALSVEDHYVDIITDKGKALVLMRLADAMREAGTTEGLQIHRSHWVARDAVARLLRTDGKVLVELTNGMRLPVSRSYLPAVRALGLG